MVRRHLRLFGLFGLLVLLVFGCRTAAPRTPAGSPQPLAGVPVPRQPLPEASPTLAINDTTPPTATPNNIQPPTLPAPPALVVKQPRPAEPVKTQVAVAPSPAVSVTPGPTVPVTNGTPTPNTSAGTTPLRTLHRLCAEKYASIDSYIVGMHRREVNNGTKQPEEELLFKFRKEPWGVYFKWLGTVANGREVVYVKGRYNNQMHILAGSGEGLLMPKGKRMSLDPTSSLVTSKSRHSITEAGVGNMIERFGNLLEVDELNNSSGKLLRYLGPVQRPEYGSIPLEAVHQIILPGREPQLARGGQRWWFFDTALRLPVMVITVDDRNQEVEYYRYERFLFPGRVSDEEFNPDFLGRKS